MPAALLPSNPNEQFIIPMAFIRYNHPMLTKLNDVEWSWVNQPQHLLKVAEELASEDILAVDTESNSLYAYQEQVCLIQFSTKNKDFLIDTMALPDISVLQPIFNSSKILKVFHAAEYDLICLFRDYGFRFNNLFDTMIAARTLGLKSIGLGALLETYFNVQVEKKYQRANWGKRPLNPEMLSYARMDSRFLIPLQEKLRLALKSTDRWELALEDFRRLTVGIEDTTESNTTDFWKIHGARDLNPVNAAVLKYLYEFREAQAASQNKPPFKVLSNQALINIAEACPRERQTLSNLPGIHHHTINRYGKGLIQAVETGMAGKPEHPPHYQRPENAVLERIEALREWRKLAGRRLGVPSDVILPRDVLNRIAWADPKKPAELQQEMYDVPHRFERFGQDILQELKQQETI